MRGNVTTAKRCIERRLGRLEAQEKL